MGPDYHRLPWQAGINDLHSVEVRHIAVYIPGSNMHLKCSSCDHLDVKERVVRSA